MFQDAQAKLICHKSILKKTDMSDARNRMIPANIQDTIDHDPGEPTV